MKSLPGTDMAKAVRILTGKDSDRDLKLEKSWSYGDRCTNVQ
ncbi:MAG: hypothetical protein AB2L14_20450 [Candidatus Xenobiia bacterium LiM19]